MTAEKLGPGTLKFGDTGSAKEFQAQTSKTEFKPELKLEDPTGMLDGSDYQAPGEWSGTISGTFFQSYGVDSLIAWCYEHAGEIMPFTFAPKGETGISFAGRCVIMPVSVGGEAKKTNTTDFEFKVIDRAELKKPGDS